MNGFRTHEGGRMLRNEVVRNKKKTSGSHFPLCFSKFTALSGGRGAIRLQETLRLFCQEPVTVTGSLFLVFMTSERHNMGDVTGLGFMRL